MFAKPQSEHEWFSDLHGDWEFTHECNTGADSPGSHTTGRVHARSIGGLWIVLESTGEMPDHGSWTSIMTLGFDPKKQRYVGTFIGSMMTNLWVYEGQLDASRKQLILDVEGPKFDGSGTARYQDIVEIVSRDHWILRSQILGDDGQWTQFLVGHHRRVS